MQLNRLLLPLAALAGCANAVDGGAAPDLPIASLSCPAHAEAGVAFTVDGSASRAPDGGFASTTLTLVPGDQSAAALTGSFTAANAGVVTAKLVVKDAAGNTAEARCRVVVDPAAGEGEGEGDIGEGEGEGGVLTGDVDLSGDFAMLAYDMPQLAGGSLDPATQCGAAPALALVHLEQNGKHVEMSERWCAVSLPDVQILALGVQHTDIPDALVDALPAVSASFDVASTAPGATFAPPLAQVGAPVVVGAHLDDPSGPLPTDANDPQVSDDDDDGWPGVTITSSGNAEDVVYRRFVRAFSGHIVDADTIDGATPGSYQAEGQAALLSNLFSFMVPTGQGLPSTFRMVRIADGATCGDVRDQADALEADFPPPPAPDGCAEF